MGIAAIMLPALLIEHYTGYAAPNVVFFGVVLAAFFGMMFGAWNVQSAEPLDSELIEVDDDSCLEAPKGWACTREAGHDGPCAAVQTEIFHL